MVIISFGLPLTYAYTTLRQIVAGNSPFRGIVFCNFGTSKTVINIRHHGKYCYPIYFPIWLPQRCSRGTKKLEETKKLVFKNVLIPWYPISYLTIASSGFFFWGRLHGSLPDAAIWWCLRTGGGGVRSRIFSYKIVHVGDFILYCISVFFVHLSTDSFIPEAKGGTLHFFRHFFAVPSNAYEFICR